jgi:hypothetical protein
MRRSHETPLQDFWLAVVKMRIATKLRIENS